MRVFAFCSSLTVAAAFLSGCGSNADAGHENAQGGVIASTPAEDAADLKTIGQLKASGSDLSKRADMRHYLFVPTAAAATAAAKALNALGYRTETAPPDVNGTSRYASSYEVRASVTAVPSIDTVRAARAVFKKLAADYGGAYAGWKAQVVH